MLGALPVFVVGDLGLKLVELILVDETTVDLLDTFRRQLLSVDELSKGVQDQLRVQALQLTLLLRFSHLLN